MFEPMHAPPQKKPKTPEFLVVFSSIAAILKYYRVRSYKVTRAGKIVIRKGGFWLYFNQDMPGYHTVGASQKLDHDKFR